MSSAGSPRIRRQSSTLFGNRRAACWRYHSSRLLRTSLPRDVFGTGNIKVPRHQPHSLLASLLASLHSQPELPAEIEERLPADEVSRARRWRKVFLTTTTLDDPSRLPVDDLVEPLDRRVARRPHIHAVDRVDSHRHGLLPTTPTNGVRDARLTKLDDGLLHGSIVPIVPSAPDKDRPTRPRCDSAPPC